MAYKKIAFMLFVSLALLISGCSNVNVNDKQNDDTSLEKCIESFNKGQPVNKSNEMPSYLKDAIAKEFCKQAIEQGKQQVEEAGNSIYGIFLDQGLVLSKGGGVFTIEVKNNEGDGSFTIKIEKTLPASGNDIDFVISEDSFSIPSWGDKVVKVTAKPGISQGYKLGKDYFPIKVIALKNNALFQEAEVIITVDTS